MRAEAVPPPPPPREPCRLDGLVAIVTGGGRGLGRSHARLLASRGARVVVNDPGVDEQGAGRDASVADRVVAEILDVGGQAVASHDRVDAPSGAAAVVAAALDAWGRLDIVVHSAGILRDVTVANMSREQFDDVLAVHLRGGIHVCRAAWPYLRLSGHGRIVQTTSATGLYGNVGQANYAAAKAALVGLVRTLALEGAADGIHANAIAPAAVSRLNEGLLPAAIVDHLAPEQVAPLVLHLVSPNCAANGQVFSIGGGLVARVAIVEGPGAVLPVPFTPEDVAEHWDEIMTVPLVAGTVEAPDGAMAQLDRIATAIGRPVGSQ